MSKNIAKIPGHNHPVTRPAPFKLFVVQLLSHHILRDNDFLVFGVFVTDDKFAECDAIKLRKSDPEVSTDLTDVFRPREAAMSAVILTWAEKNAGFRTCSVFSKMKGFSINGKKQLLTEHRDRLAWLQCRWQDRRCKTALR